MAKTASHMLPLGTPAPIFTLEDVTSGQQLNLSKTPQSNATVIMFICNHCPYVKHIASELTKLSNDYQDKGVQFIAINSNDVENYPADSPENMKITAQENQYPFPYLFDPTQEVAKAYNAACTPDFYLFNKDLVLEYRGQLDDSRPGNDKPVTGESLRDALDCILANKAVNPEQKPSLGCNIKWKNN